MKIIIVLAFVCAGGMAEEAVKPPKPPESVLREFEGVKPTPPLVQSRAKEPIIDYMVVTERDGTVTKIPIIKHLTIPWVPVVIPPKQ